LSQDEKYAHIDEKEIEKVAKEHADAVHWFNEQQQKQMALPKHADPCVTIGDISGKLKVRPSLCSAELLLRQATGYTRLFAKQWVFFSRLGVLHTCRLTAYISRGTPLVNSFIRRFGKCRVSLERNSFVPDDYVKYFNKNAVPRSFVLFSTFSRRSLSPHQSSVTSHRCSNHDVAPQAKVLALPLARDGRDPVRELSNRQDTQGSCV